MFKENTDFDTSKKKNRDFKLYKIQTDAFYEYSNGPNIQT